MPGRNLRIGRIAGIPVGISPWWLVIVALLTWTLSGDYSDLDPAWAVAVALAAVLCLFAGILAHEFAHALVARRAGIEIEEIDLWLLGGVARMRSQPRRAGDELRFALAGPAVTVVLAIGFGIATALLGPGTLRTFVAYQAEINAALAVFNLLPALPLDGGRVARALLWRRSGDFRRATVIAARAGRWSGLGMIYFGLLATLGGYLGGLWLTMIGLFLVAAAGAEQRMAEWQAAVQGLTAGAVMSTPAVTLDALMTLPEAREAIRRSGFATYPVVAPEGEALGLLEARRAAMSEAATVGQACERDHELIVSPQESAASLLERPAFLARGRAVVVDADRRPLGVVSITDLERRRQASPEPAAPSRHGPAEVHR